jgi:hypothetical protein
MKNSFEYAPKPISLEIDKILYKDGIIPPIVKLERRIILSMLKILHKNGWRVLYVESEGRVKARSIKATMEEIFSLDECRVWFTQNDKPLAFVYLVCGNGVDVISDYTMNLNRLLNPKAFNTEIFE